MLDGYSVCQHCFEPTPGVFTVDGLTYCEDCYPLIVGEPSEREAAGSGTGERDQPGQLSGSNETDAGVSARPRGRRPTPMSLHATSVHRQHHPFVSSPIPEPSPIYRQVAVRHRGRTIRFEGAPLRAGAHFGLNPLWKYENETPGKYTWVEAYRKQEGDFILVSRIVRENKVSSSVAFRFTRDRLVIFLKTALRNADTRQGEIWRGILKQIGYR